MKKIIDEQEVKKFNYYGNIFSIHFLVLIISAAPLFIWLERYAFIPFGVLFAITMFWALKVEKIKKENDIQTYKEIVAFTDGKKLDELHKAVENMVNLMKENEENKKRMVLSIVCGIITIIAVVSLVVIVSYIDLSRMR